jgi:hypothetical protein
MLAQHEGKRHARMARRRLLTLLVPGLVTVAWATTQLVSARHARLADDGAAAVRLVVDPALPVLWAFFFVVLPLMWALKPRPLPAGAALALLAGPVLSPILFGPGGWRPWQIAILSLVAWLVLVAAVARARRFPD